MNPKQPFSDWQDCAAKVTSRLHAAIDKALRRLRVGQSLAVSDPRLVDLGDAGREIRCEVLVLEPGEAPPTGVTWTVYGPMTEEMAALAKDGR